MATAGGSSPPTTTIQADVITTHHPEIEVDTYSDNDSTFTDSDFESYTTSLSSSAFDYQYENGRRYHKFREGKYFLPNDEAEKDRLDMHHHMLTIVQKGDLHGCKLENPQAILDLGTGTGIWAIEMADNYPSAVVTGNDLSPIQPNWVPTNVKFEVDDFESEWTYPENTFDMIYARYLLGGITDYPKLFAQAFKALKPGGYLEIFEPDSILRSDDNSLPEDSALNRWNNLFIKAAEIGGRPVTDGPKHKEYFKELGFVDIHEDIFKLPNAPWPKDKYLKEVGAYHMASFLEALEGLSMRFFTTLLKMAPEEVQVLLVDVRKDLKNKAFHTYYDLYRVYARKPE
ncbi:hypothetical protein ABW19_dt0206031 [Dactylella cylindrospora]|nr:hypothetical protein ABW19_dt0206031 [Dactylella cylindrospora]